MSKVPVEQVPIRARTLAYAIRDEIIRFEREVGVAVHGVDVARMPVIVRSDAPDITTVNYVDLKLVIEGVPR